MVSIADIKTLFDAGAHFGFSRARRHPTAAKYLFGTKDRTDIFDLETTTARLEEAKAFVSSLSQSGKQIVFVGGKHEASQIVKEYADRIGQPYVSGRWIGGTLTNFKNIRKRIDLLLKLQKDKEEGTLDKYTKRERVMIDRDIENLISRFGGLVSLNELPAALFVVDTRHENTAVLEAKQMNIPVVGLSSSDGDFALIKYPIPANDTSVRSIRLVTEEIAEAYQDGKKVAK